MDLAIKKLLSDNKVAGLRQVIRGINCGHIRCVLLADDTDELIKRELLDACNSHSIKVLHCASKAELGKELGLDRPCATVGFTKSGE